MRQEQHPFRGGGAEPGEEVPQVERVPLPRHVPDVLHDHGVRPAAHLGEQPVPRLPVGGGSRDAGPERHLTLEIGERRPPVELFGPSTSPSLTGQDDQRRAPRTGHHAPPHRSCPMLVDSCTKAVITTCATLRLVCRSSFRR